jgi:hypothetical protein
MTKPGKAADGIAKTEVDHHRKWPAAGSGSICATFVKCSSIFMTRGDPQRVKVFATTDAAEKWFEENDPEGVAFEYEVLE